jgi:hypothetical protein
MAKTYTPIATQTLTTSVATVTFSSIPSTYTDLVLVANASSVASTQTIGWRANSDSGSNYSDTYLGGDGSSAFSGRNSNQTYAYFGSINTSRSTLLLNFMNYSNTTTNKTSIARSNSTDYAIARVNLWRSTSAISSIDINTAGSTFATGSTFTLYGIKAA